MVFFLKHRQMLIVFRDFLTKLTENTSYFRIRHLRPR